MGRLFCSHAVSLEWMTTNPIMFIIFCIRPFSWIEFPSSEPCVCLPHHIRFIVNCSQTINVRSLEISWIVTYAIRVRIKTRKKPVTATPQRQWEKYPLRAKCLSWRDEPLPRLRWKDANVGLRNNLDTLKDYYAKALRYRYDNMSLIGALPWVRLREIQEGKLPTYPSMFVYTRNPFYFAICCYALGRTQRGAMQKIDKI